MKTTKILLVITFVAFATMIFAQADRPNQNEPAPIQNCVKISLEKAQMDRALKAAMYQQVRLTLLVPDKPIYIAKVRLSRTVYYVHGSYDDWKEFLLRGLDVYAISAIE